MSLFELALDVLHDNDDIGDDASYRVGGLEPGAAIRLVLKRPTFGGDFAGINATIPAFTADVRVSDVATPARGDTIAVGTALYRVESVEPDSMRFLNVLALKVIAVPIVTATISSPVPSVDGSAAVT